MNIYQRIILVIGSIGMAVVIYTALDTAHASREIMEISKGKNVTLKELEVFNVFLKNDCRIAIIKSAIIALLTFSAYVGFKSRKSG